MSDRRRRLPDERAGFTHKFSIKTADDSEFKGRTVKGYITVGLFDDGTVGEVFVKIDQQGSQVSGFCDAWAIGVSMLLQRGTPLETICQKFRGSAFEPSGLTGDPEIRVARSPVDYVARWLERRFLPRREAVA